MRYINKTTINFTRSEGHVLVRNCITISIIKSSNKIIKLVFNSTNSRKYCYHHHCCSQHHQNHHTYTYSNYDSNFDVTIFIHVHCQKTSLVNYAREDTIQATDIQREKESHLFGIITETGTRNTAPFSTHEMSNATI